VTIEFTKFRELEIAFFDVSLADQLGGTGVIAVQGGHSVKVIARERAPFLGTHVAERD